MKGKEYRRLKNITNPCCRTTVKQIKCKYYECDGQFFGSRTKLAEYIGVTSWAIIKHENKYDIHLTEKTEVRYEYRGFKIRAFR